MFDNPSISDPDYDFPSTLIEAMTVENYVPISGWEAYELCNQTKKLCAICAEPDMYGYPLLRPSDYIVVHHLDPYFRISNETLRVPNLNFIKEKFTY